MHLPLSHGSHVHDVATPLHDADGVGNPGQARAQAASLARRHPWPAIPQPDRVLVQSPLPWRSAQRLRRDSEGRLMIALSIARVRNEHLAGLELLKLHMQPVHRLVKMRHQLPIREVAEGDTTFR